MSKAIKETVKKQKTTRKTAAKDIPGEQALELSSSEETSAAGKYRNFGYPILILLILALLLYIGNRFFIVAWVDKKPITRIEFYNALEKRYGNSIKEELAVEKLVQSEANKKGIRINKTDLDNEIKRIEEEQGGAKNLAQVLELQGINQGDFKNIVELQLIKQKLFGGDINISDEEVNKYIEENKEMLQRIDEQINDKTKDNIREQLKQQKINNNFNEWLKEALKSSRVVRV